MWKCRRVVLTVHSSHFWWKQMSWLPFGEKRVRGKDFGVHFSLWSITWQYNTREWMINSRTHFQSRSVISGYRVPSQAKVTCQELIIKNWHFMNKKNKKHTWSSSAHIFSLNSNDYGLKFWFPPGAQRETLSLTVMVFDDGAFRRGLNLDMIASVGLWMDECPYV